MSTMKKRACALLLVATSAYGHEYFGQSFKVIHPWALPSEPGATSAAVYVRFEEISAGDRLLSASTRIAEKVEFRTPASTSGKTDSSALKAIDLQAGPPLELTPGGKHLMLIDLKEPLQLQRSYPMTLVFEKSGSMQVMISIGAH